MTKRDETSKKISRIIDRAHTRKKLQMDREEPQLSNKSEPSASGNENPKYRPERFYFKKPQPKKEHWLMKTIKSPSWPVFWAWVAIMFIVLGLGVIDKTMHSEIVALESSLSELEAEHLDLIKSLSEELNELKEHEHEAVAQPIVVNVNQESEADAQERLEQEEICEDEAEYTDTCTWQDEYDVSQTRVCDPGWYCHVWRDGSSYVDQCKKRKCEL